MHCVIKNEMKFGDYVIPARIKARVVNKPSYKEANVPGLHLLLSVRLSDIALMKKESVLLTEVEIKNEYEDSYYNSSKMIGIVIETDGTKVLMDAEDKFYDEATLYEFQVKKVLEVDEIPEEIKIAPYTSGQYYLESLVSYLEDQFAEWVQDNCEFYTYTEEDIENGECYADAEEGDTTLSAKGLEQFENKKVEYQSMLEKIGFTYDFKGGLIWDC